MAHTVRTVHTFKGLKMIFDKQHIRVETYHYAPGYARTDEPPTNLQEYLLWVAARLGEVPEEHRATATLETESYEHYHDTTYSVTVSYVRPETDDEHAIRVAREEHERQAREEALRRELDSLMQTAQTVRPETKGQTDA